MVCKHGYNPPGGAHSLQLWPHHPRPQWPQHPGRHYLIQVGESVFRCTMSKWRRSTNAPRPCYLTFTWLLRRPKKRHFQSSSSYQKAWYHYSLGPRVIKSTKSWKSHILLSLSTNQSIVWLTAQPRYKAIILTLLKLVELSIKCCRKSPQLPTPSRKSPHNSIILSRKSKVSLFLPTSLYLSFKSVRKSFCNGSRMRLSVL